MKQIITIIIAILAMNVSLAGGNKKYIKAIESNLESLYAAETAEAYDPVANKFIRIAEAEKDQWLPYYYASLAYVFKSLKIKANDQRDEVLDQAQTKLAMASDLASSNSEITALDGFIYMMKISIDPGTRGQTLSPKAMGAFAAAIKMDPTNPRAMLFMGQMHHGMAQFFGSGTEQACATIAKSVELFENNEPESSISPAWGKSIAKQWAERCTSPVEETDSGDGK